MPGVVLAQNDGAGPAALEEVIVTARFREENLQTTPVAITAIRGEELTAMGLTNTSEIGRVIPNAFIRQGAGEYGRSSQIYIRGVGQGDYGYFREPRTATYIDDVYYASVFGSVFDLLDVSQIEVLRGPQGTLFGRNAMGGAMRVVSNAPEGGGAGYVEATFGDFDRNDLRGSFDQTLIEDKLFLRFSGVSKHRDGHQRQLDFRCQMIQEGTPQYAGIGDGVIGWNPDPDGDGPLQGSPIMGVVGSAQDDEFSFPSLRPGGGDLASDCMMGRLGGEDVQAARAMLRWVATDNFEATFTAHYADDNSSVQSSWLSDLGDNGQANTVPGTTTGLPAAFVNYNNAVIGQNWGIAFDSRFLRSNPFETFATYNNILTNEQYPAVSTAKSKGWSAKFDWDLRENLALTVVLASHEVDGEFTADTDYSPVPISLYWQPSGSDEQSFEARLSGLSFNDRFDWTFGVFNWDAAQYNAGRVSIDYILLPFLIFNVDDRNDAENKGIYFHSVTKLTDKLNLTAGLRTSDDDKVFSFSHYFDASVSGGGSSEDWQLGLDYQLNDRMMVYLSGASGYTASTFNGRPFTPAQLIPQPPEELVSYEIGFKTDFDNARFDATIFHSDYKNRIAGTTSGLDDDNIPITIPVNGPAVIDGIEFELAASVGDFWNVNFALGYLEYSADAIAAGAPNSNNPCGATLCVPARPSGAPPGQPQRNASAGLSYFASLPNGGSITPRLDIFWTDEVEQVLPGATIAPYSLTNARVTYQTADKDWSISLALTNASDKFYILNNFDNRNLGGGTLAQQVGRPREWSLSFRHDFGQ
jgi:iron complex outermembrane receptor protein